MRRGRVTVSLAALLLGHAAPDADADPQLSHVLAVFSIAKSQNKNQVQYTVRVDDHCAPVGPSPVSAYWRMLARGPNVTEPILSVEERAYGLAQQAVITRDASGGQVRIVLRALASRPVTIVTSHATNGTCLAVATTTIAGAPANLFNVYVRLGWNGVDYLLLQGWAPDGSRVLREKVSGAN